MSTQEQRNEIIRLAVPKLIKQLTGYEDDSEKFRQYEHFAMSTIRNHRYLSTNSHEVRRNIERMKEKFDFDNLSKHGDYLVRMCNQIIEHPLCVKHYEVDVHWSLIEFLLSIAYNPTGALRRNKNQIDLNLNVSEISDVEEDPEVESIKNLLKEDFIKYEQHSRSNSDLSEWSNDSVNTSDNESTKVMSLCSKDQSNLNLIKDMNHIKPPEKPVHYKLFTGEKSKEFLEENVQHSWWLDDPENAISQAKTGSENLEANFAVAYTKFLEESMHPYMPLEAPSTATEECLLREIIWMFHAPQDCKFFTIIDGNIRVRDNVSVPSTTASGLANFLEAKFIPYISMMQTLQEFVNSSYTNRCTQTLECYAASLRLILQSFWRPLLKYEKRVIAQCDFDINTIITLSDYLQNMFQQLQSIYELHKDIVLDVKEYEPHIYSAYLLSALLNAAQNASITRDAYIAISIFLLSIKAYCSILETWWSEGRLYDCHEEFVVQKSSNDERSVCPRQFYKIESPQHISKFIAENNILHLLIEHSMELGSTLNLLYEINRIGDLRTFVDVTEGNLYNAFFDNTMQFVYNLQSDSKSKGVESIAAPNIAIINEEAEAANLRKAHSEQQKQNILSNLTTKDDFLLMAFNSAAESIDSQESDTTANKQNGKKKCGSDCNIWDILHELEKTRDFLPMEEVMFSSLQRVLKIRLALANSFVIQLYRDEFHILHHFRNLRKILLLEASDTMQQFYEQLFSQIELGQPWAHAYTLTIQLDEIISSKYPEMESLFRVEIESISKSIQTMKVYEAIDQLTIAYNCSPELSRVITTEDINEYNTVFRFLLKVKWALQTLLCLSFARKQKRYIPYAPFQMIDLIMRRLQQVRFWMIYSLQNVHSHLVTYVLQSMGEQLDNKVSNCANINEVQNVHRSFVQTVGNHCFLSSNLKPIKMGIEQLLNLTYIMKLEWASAVNFIEDDSPLSLDNSSSEEPNDTVDDYIANAQIDEIELTYIRCHQYLAKKLSTEVYYNQNSFLSGLCAVFNTSMPC